MMNFSYIAPLGLGYLVYRMFYKPVAPLGLNEAMNPCFSRFTPHVINSCKLAPLVNVLIGLRISEFPYRQCGAPEDPLPLILAQIGEVVKRELK